MAKRMTGTNQRRTQAPKGGAGRRKYTEGIGGQCSVDKHAGKEKSSSKPMVVTQAQFVHQASRDTTTSEHSKPGNLKQVTCRKWFDGIASSGLKELRREFIAKIKKYTPPCSQDAFNDPANANKNRYDDVGLLDKTRVKVTINPENDDYIHASNVIVQNDLVYICAQGPLENTVMQFWLMCIQEEVKVILQLCKNTEAGKEKCSDYMPEGPKGTKMTYGAVEVLVLDKSKTVAGAKKVTKTKVQVTFKERACKITHLYYYGWPDHAVPESVATCREVRTMVHKLYEKKPIVVHCSAGIGRTGTFVAAEMVLRNLIDENSSDFTMTDVIRCLRDQRLQAVQNDQQFCFIIRFVLDILIADDFLTRSSRVNSFIQEFDELVERKKKLLKERGQID